ncbi:unnamed protein product [Protopolystoma xenopodis]|uniref:Uncharacterized protein n=1 Tax=Protopolystoma xenopodis TaxID=117903 RepID=A0A448WES8_9PLAT|nr:unnamed protein product [Protopolystoma xenopodis]
MCFSPPCNDVCPPCNDVCPPWSAWFNCNSSDCRAGIGTVSRKRVCFCDKVADSQSQVFQSKMGMCHETSACRTACAGQSVFAERLEEDDARSGSGAQPFPHWLTYFVIAFCIVILIVGLLLLCQFFHRLFSPKLRQQPSPGQPAALLRPAGLPTVTRALSDLSAFTNLMLQPQMAVVSSRVPFAATPGLSLDAAGATSRFNLSMLPVPGQLFNPAFRHDDGHDGVLPAGLPDYYALEVSSSDSLRGLPPSYEKVIEIMQQALPSADPRVPMHPESAVSAVGASSEADFAVPPTTDPLGRRADSTAGDICRCPVVTSCLEAVEAEVETPASGADGASWIPGPASTAGSAGRQNLALLPRRHPVL